MGQKTKSSLPSLKEMLDSVRYDRWENPALLRAFQLMREVNDWLETCYAPQYKPEVHIAVHTFAMIFMVGDICVWDSENYTIDDLCLDHIKDQLKEDALERMVPFT